MCLVVSFAKQFYFSYSPELSKPATEIYPHTLSSILDSAVRVTNAQFENPDTLQRLDVRLMEVSQGDVGWDVFTLLYHIDGPIGTVFEPTLDAYRTLFGALWKSKRMEYSLSCMWKRQIISARIFRRIKGRHIFFSIFCNQPYVSLIRIYSYIILKLIITYFLQKFHQ